MKYIKKCVLCEVEKSKNEFPETDRGRGSAEYCLTCFEMHKNDCFIYNQYDQVIAAFSPGKADDYLLADILYFKKGKYYLHKDKSLTEFLPPTKDKIISMGKYNEKRLSIDYHIATKLVDEQAAIWENNQKIRYLFSGKELENFIVYRDQNICYYCSGYGDKISFLISRSEGGLLTPLNTVCCCSKCKEIEGENLYFYKWLNVPISNGNDGHVIKMWDVKKQNCFRIKEEFANRLIQEEMAVWISDFEIQILYDRKSFRDFLIQRDGETCFYCGKNGTTIDHVFPQTKGGFTTVKNCVIACFQCNEKKGDSVF
jgi:hypothetical protein